MKIILPMAGFGTRLRPHTWSVPKPLVPLAGKAMIDHVLDRLLPLDPTEIVCIVGYLGDQLEAYLRGRYQVPFRFVEQAEMRGQAHAIALTRGLVEGPSLVVFADTIFEADFGPLRELDADGALYVKEVDDPRRFGVVVRDTEGYIRQLVEKPEQPVSNLAVVGIYYFRETEALHEAIDALLRSGTMLKGEYYLADAIQLMIDRGQKLRCFTIPVWQDCGKPEELLQTNRYLLDKDDPAPPAYPDSVVIRPSYVDPSATVARSVIGPHASIGAGATIEGAVIENSIVGERATVRNLALSGSILSADAAAHGTARRLNLGATSELAE
jgi:glucose-1-phosphate thymidylyltransferase